MPAVRNARQPSCELIHGGADFERLRLALPRPRSTFNVGYIGLLSFLKIHPDFVQMSAAILISNVKVIVCGEGTASASLISEVEDRGLTAHFEFRGYVEEIADVIAEFDVFGYPLCAENYTTAELVLQQVMFAGVPAVVLPFGGAASMVVHGETGLIARNEKEYAGHIQYLHDHPAERLRLGGNAAMHARQNFGAQNSALRFNAVYRRMLQQPKCARVPAVAEPIAESVGAWL